MSENRRLVLWANDSPMNAVDSVCETIVAEITRHLNDAEEDQCFVNDVIAYVRCLTGVYDWAGGGFVDLAELRTWRNRVVAVIEKMPDSHYSIAKERTSDLEFVREVFDDLMRIVDRLHTG